MIDFLFNLLFSAGSYLGVVLIAFFFLSSALKIIPEYQRGVVFRLGRMIGAKGPGLVIVIPFIDRVIRVDLRVMTLDVPVQEVITKDNVPIKVNAVVYFRVMEPTRSIVEVENYAVATSQLSQTTLRAVLGRSELDDILTARDQINMELQQIIDEKTDPWGIKVSAVEVKELELPEGMKRAMASQAEAERERRAKIISAEGELQASERLSQAALVMERSPITLQLRYLQTLRDVASEKNSTTIFPIPMDLIKPFLRKMTQGAKDED
ncbi:slipin family protein [Aminithiophilus ramosus]|uniref:Slipin family protein n=2 Tax=Synergistales TaxID=649776 RepID=A0A9Q7AK82_9BACT|nr:slipin family protein [Aminithiophilus ramosus]QTX31432.1 slipin family protein [Aminithiophilus ramosus]QVL35235.1 slipin family protein [Synergistota bacterium]